MPFSNQAFQSSCFLAFLWHCWLLACPLSGPCHWHCWKREQPSLSHPNSSASSYVGCQAKAPQTWNLPAFLTKHLVWIKYGCATVIYSGQQIDVKLYEDNNETETGMLLEKDLCERFQSHLRTKTKIFKRGRLSIVFNSYRQLVKNQFCHRTGFSFHILRCGRKQFSGQRGKLTTGFHYKQGLYITFLYQNADISKKKYTVWCTTVGLEPQSHDEAVENQYVYWFSVE